MAQAGTKPYWIAFEDADGGVSTDKIKSAADERNYGRIIARSYKYTVVAKIRRAAERRAESRYGNPSSALPVGRFIKVKAILRPNGHVDLYGIR